MEEFDNKYKLTKKGVLIRLKDNKVLQPTSYRFMCLVDGKPTQVNLLKTYMKYYSKDYYEHPNLRFYLKDGNCKNIKLNNISMELADSYFSDLYNKYKKALREFFSERDKQCCYCFEVKPIDSFYKRTIEYEDYTYTNISKTCKGCEMKYNNKRTRNLAKESDFFHFLTNQRIRVSIGLRSALNQKRQSKHKAKYIGCSWVELKEHIESQFDVGMSWDNYGVKGWHVDHVKPLLSASSIDELIPLLHYTNMRPLWAEENIKRRSNI